MTSRPPAGLTERGALPLQTRLAPIAHVDRESRTAEVTWTTGARVKRYDWERGHAYLEELSLDSKHVRMERLRHGAPLLNAHRRFDVADVVGVVEAATLGAGEGRATVRFSDRAEVEPIFRDVQAKILRNVSAGYVVHRYEMLPPDERSEGLPIYRATDWEPMELSLVPVGADAGAQVRGDESTPTYPCHFIERKDAMENEQVTSPPDAENARPSPAEQARARTIHELCKQNGIGREAEDGFLTRGDSVKEVRSAILAILAERSNAAPIRGGFAPSGEIRGNLPAMLPLIQEAWAQRAGGPKASAQASEFLHMRALDVARLCLDACGIGTRLMSNTEIVKRALHTTSDFPELLSGTGYRVLRSAYEAHTSGLMRVFKRATAPDFRARQKLALSEAPALLEVKPSSEFKRGTMAETKESYALATYGRILGLSRQAIINDDLNAFGTMAMRFGQAAAELVANTLAAKLHSNPTLNADSKAVYHVDHVNLSTGAANGTINVDTLGAGIKAVRLQEGISGNVVLGLAPKYLVVPATLEQVAKQYTSTGYTPAVPSNVNPWGSTLEPIVEPRLDALSTTAWYLFADPEVFDCFEYAYLEGEEGPYVEARSGFEVDGLEVKCRLDLGCGATEYRGTYKNAGA